MPLSGQDFRAFGKAAGVGGLGAGVMGLMFPGDSPYDQAKPYYDKIPGMLQNTYNPYIQSGMGSMGQLQGQYGSLINNPGSKLNEIGQGYQQSPGYQWQLGQALQAGNNAAAAGGMAGTPMHQQQQMATAQGLANQDYYNYLGNALGLYGTGLSGQQGMMNQGFNASNELASGLGSTWMNQGNLAMSGQAAENQAQSQMWGNIFGGLGALAFL